jgi:hypothetical protein
MSEEGVRAKALVLRSSGWSIARRNDDLSLRVMYTVFVSHYLVGARLCRRVR